MKPTILIVDDNRELLYLFEELLANESYSIDTADNFELAINFLSEKEYDIVILDKNFPGHHEPIEGGMELLRYIKINMPSTEVIMITGFATINSAIEAMKIGAFDYLHKPFRRDDIRKKIKRLLEYKSFLDPESTIQNYKIIFNKILEHMPEIKNNKPKGEKELTDLMSDVDLLFNVQKDLERIVITQRDILEAVAGEVEKLKEFCNTQPQIQKITHRMEKLVLNRV